MRPLIFAALGALLLGGAALAQGMGMGYSLKADQVSPLATKARTPSPAWWKVSDADTTVWILGSSGAARSVRWDSKPLETRIAGANTLIVPDLGIGIGSIASITTTAMRYANDDTPYRNRLPARLLQRLTALKPKSGANTRTIMLAMEVGRMSQPDPAPKPVSDSPGDVAESLAKRAKVRVTEVSTPLPIADMMKTMSTMPEADQQACLASALDNYDQRAAVQAAGRRAAEAWAQGDVPAAVTGGDGQMDCAMPASLSSMMTRQQSALTTAISAELQKPGKAVAVIDLNALVSKGGVLEQLKAKGFQVTPPNLVE